MGTHLRMQLRTQRDRQLGRTQPLPLARWSKSGGDKIYSPMQGCLLLELTRTPTRAPQALGKHWMALQQSATSSDMLLPSEQTRGNKLKPARLARTRRRGELGSGARRAGTNGTGREQSPVLPSAARHPSGCPQRLCPAGGARPSCELICTPQATGAVT